MDINLHENGATCPACELRREEENTKISGRADVPCNNCGGTGRISAGVQTVINMNTAWAKKHYWPEREARWRIFNEAQERRAAAQ